MKSQSLRDYKRNEEISTRRKRMEYNSKKALLDYLAEVCPSNFLVNKVSSFYNPIANLPHTLCLNTPIQQREDIEILSEILPPTSGLYKVSKDATNFYSPNELVTLSKGDKDRASKCYSTIWTTSFGRQRMIYYHQLPLHFTDNIYDHEFVKKAFWQVQIVADINDDHLIQTPVYCKDNSWIKDWDIKNLPDYGTKTNLFRTDKREKHNITMYWDNEKSFKLAMGID